MNMSHAKDAAHEFASFVGSSELNDESSSSALVEFLSGLTALFKTTNAPKLDSLDANAIKTFLELYDQYGKQGGRKNAIDCVSKSIVSYIYQYVDVDDGVNDQVILKFLNEKSMIGKNLPFEEKIDSLNNIGIDFTQSDKVSSLLLSLEKALHEIGFDGSSSDTFYVSEELQINLLLNKLPQDLYMEMEKRLLFVQKPITKKKFKCVLENVSKNYTWPSVPPLQHVPLSPAPTVSCLNGSSTKSKQNNCQNVSKNYTWPSAPQLQHAPTPNSQVGSSTKSKQKNCQSIRTMPWAPATKSNLQLAREESLRNLKLRIENRINRMHE